MPGRPLGLTATTSGPAGMPCAVRDFLSPRVSARCPNPCRRCLWRSAMAALGPVSQLRSAHLRPPSSLFPDSAFVDERKAFLWVDGTHPSFRTSHVCRACAPIVGHFPLPTDARTHSRSAMHRATPRGTSTTSDAPAQHVARPRGLSPSNEQMASVRCFKLRHLRRWRARGSMHGGLR